MSHAALRSDVRLLLDGWRETYLGKEYNHAGLLVQLREEVTDSGGARDENRSGKATSPKLPGNEGAMSLIVEVEERIGELVRWTGADRESQSVENNLQWLVRVAKDYDEASLAYVVGVVAQVRHQLELALDWTPAGRKLKAECPTCTGGPIIVHASEPGEERARCENCLGQWVGESGLKDLAKAINDKEGIIHG